MVCVGNICRSPMAEYLFQSRFDSHNAGIQVSSAGLGALVGHAADPFTIELLAEQGVDATPHIARQITTTIAAQHELILVMENWQKKELESLIPISRGRVFLLGKWIEQEIPDPYKRPREQFEATLQQVDASYHSWASRLL